MTVLPRFQQYQMQFSAHIRDPVQHKKPPGVIAERMRVYTEIVFNNLESTLASCFPVSKKTIGRRAWLKLVRGFFSGHVCHTPIFREIPQEFLHYLAQVEALPCYLPSLAHYEWAELAVSVAEDRQPLSLPSADGNLLDEQIIFAPALMLLSYDYPVHLISPRFKPKVPSGEPVYLLVYRDMVDEVRFIELNAASFKLLSKLLASEVNARETLLEMAGESKMTDTQALLRFGLEILENFKSQGVILGTQPTVLSSN